LLRRATVRPAAAAGAGSPAGQGHLRLPRARAASQGDRLAWPVVQARQGREDLLDGGRRRAERRRRCHRPAAGTAERRARLVAEARSGRTEGHHQLEGARPRQRARLARHGAGHRPHPSTSRARLRHGLADRRRQHLWQRPALRRAAAASALARYRRADFAEQGT
ncbi:hypothetical protein KXW38_001878, partial [Aspergillus fumigatus]